MNRLLLSLFPCLCVLAGLPAAAQPTMQVSLVRDSADSVPQTLLIPVQQAPLRVVEHTALYSGAQGSDRAERRALRARNHAARLDSLLLSDNYLFRPRTMQELPDGTRREIYADYFLLGVYVDHMAVHLPIEREATHRIEQLNFDSMSIRNYLVSQVSGGWIVTFDLAEKDSEVQFRLTLSTATGEAVLILLAPTVAMRYTGWLQ